MKGLVPRQKISLATFSDLSICQTNPWLRVTFDHLACFPFFFEAAGTELWHSVISIQVGFDEIHVTNMHLFCFAHWSARCLAFLSLRISLKHGVGVTEMWTLMADSLLTGLPSLVKPTGSYSKTKAYIASFYTDNKLPSSPAAVYLPFNSCQLSFLAIVFSCLLAWPPVSLERCMWISGSLLGFFFPTNMPQFYDWPMKLSLKLPCISLNISGNIKDHALQGARVQLGATAIQASSLFFPFPLFSRGLVSLQCCWRRRKASRGEGEEEEAASLPAFVSIMCHGHSWLSCSVWLSLLLQQSLFPHWKSMSLRGRRRSLLCIHFSSAQRSWALLSPCWHQLLSTHLSTAWAQLADRQLSIQIKQERARTVLWVNITAYFSNTFTIATLLN